MSQVTVIGLGPMGSTMAATLLDAGHDVTVWNRTASKADPLVARGATRAAEPATGELLVVSQIDYQAMYESLGEARLDGRTLVNLSSGTPAELREAARWVAERGGTLITGGIMVPPPAIGRPGAYTFYSGPKEALDRHAGTLEALSAVTYVGEDPGLAMMYYQAQLLLFWSSLTSFMHAAALLRTAGVRPEAFVPFAQDLYRELASDGPLGVRELAEEMESGVYPGDDNTLRMQAAGMGHVVETLRAAGLETTVPQALHRLFARAAKERGDEGLTAVVEWIEKPE